MSENYQKKFHKRNSVKEVEEGITLSPKFDENGLIPCVTTDSNTKEVLMVGYMNEEALIKTIEKGEAFYFSRSRQEVWHKGKASGLNQKINEIRNPDRIKNISTPMSPLFAKANLSESFVQRPKSSLKCLYFNINCSSSILPYLINNLIRIKIGA